MKLKFIQALIQTASLLLWRSDNYNVFFQENVVTQEVFGGETVRTANTRKKPNRNKYLKDDIWIGTEDQWTCEDQQERHKKRHQVMSNAKNANTQISALIWLISWIFKQCHMYVGYYLIPIDRFLMSSSAFVIILRISLMTQQTNKLIAHGLTVTNKNWKKHLRYQHIYI